MPGFLFHVGATAICPHGGQVSTISTNTRVMVGGQPVATQPDTYTVVAELRTVERRSVSDSATVTLRGPEVE